MHRLLGDDELTDYFLWFVVMAELSTHLQSDYM